MRIWLLTMSMPVTTSVTVCSTWMRGFISMKKHSLRVDVDEELDRAGVVVADRAAELHGGVADAPAELDRRLVAGAISTTF